MGLQRVRYDSAYTHTYTRCHACYEFCSLSFDFKWAHFPKKDFFFKLEYDCFAMLLVSTVQQSESDTHTHTYTHTYTPSLSQLPPIPSYHPSRSWQSPEQSSLGYTTASPYLFHTWLCIMSVLLPIHPTLSLLHVHKSILYVCIFIPTLQIGLSSDPFF